MLSSIIDQHGGEALSRFGMFVILIVLLELERKKLRELEL